MRGLILLSMLLLGCATAPCRPATEVMASRGQVLSCYTVEGEDGERFPVCAVIVQRHDTFEWKQVQVVPVLHPHCAISGETR